MEKREIFLFDSVAGNAMEKREKKTQEYVFPLT